MYSRCCVRIPGGDVPWMRCGITFVGVWKQLMPADIPPTTPYGRAFTAADGSWFDRAGEDLAGNFLLVVWAVRSDFDYLAKGFHLDSHNANRCHLCQCNSGTRPWTDVRVNNSWGPTIWTNRDFADRHPQLRLPLPAQVAADRSQASRPEQPPLTCKPANPRDMFSDATTRSENISL